jgi:hypothetical protein
MAGSAPRSRWLRCLPGAARSRTSSADVSERNTSCGPVATDRTQHLTVLVGEDTFTHVCELANGTVLAPGQVVPLLSEADLNGWCSTAPTGSSPSRRSGRSPVRCGGRSKCAIGTASIPRAVMNRPLAATWTTSDRTAKAARRRWRTGGSDAGPTTDTATSATRTLPPATSTCPTTVRHRRPLPDLRSSKGQVVRRASRSHVVAVTPRCCSSRFWTFSVGVRGSSSTTSTYRGSMWPAMRDRQNSTTTAGSIAAP